VHVAVQQLGADREMKGFGSRPRVQPAAEPEVVAQRLHSGGVQRDQPGLAVLAGILEIDAAFGAGELAGMRALFVLGGVVLAAFGVSLLARPGMGAITLALLFGLFNLVYWTRAIVQGIELRRVRAALRSAPRARAAA
jgi:hypothetical protein